MQIEMTTLRVRKDTYTVAIINPMEQAPKVSLTEGSAMEDCEDIAADEAPGSTFSLYIGRSNHHMRQSTSTKLYPRCRRCHSLDLDAATQTPSCSYFQRRTIRSSHGQGMGKRHRTYSCPSLFEEGRL